MTTDTPLGDRELITPQEQFPKFMKNPRYSLTNHIYNVETFMIGARQEVPFHTIVPSASTRLLRAKLIYEECMETILALGVDYIMGKFYDAGEEFYNPVELLDGICDSSVVQVGTLAACGLTGVYPEALERVDQNNLTKIGEGAVWREDGKLLKPPGYVPVDLTDLVERIR